MKNTQESDLNVVSHGGVESIKATISQDKLSKLFDLLQAPYSNPIGSIVRETVTNAWDAHVEVGQIKPIYIYFKVDAQQGYYVEFADQGVGMSEERIKTVYSNYLESTKENTNDQSGYYGIGSKAPLSYTTDYYVLTNYDGVHYEWIVRKDDDGIPVISLMASWETQEHNGTTVKLFIENSMDLRSFQREIINQLRFFEHIYVINETDIPMPEEYTNDFKMIIGKHFVMKLNKSNEAGKYVVPEEKSSDLYASIGQVAYSIDESVILKYAADWTTDFTAKYERYRDLLKKLSAAAHLEIGEVKPTLTRESIRYSRNVARLIAERVIAAGEELIDKNVYTSISDLDQLIENNEGTEPIVFLDMLLNQLNSRFQIHPDMLPIKLHGNYTGRTRTFTYRNEEYKHWEMVGEVNRRIQEHLIYRIYDIETGSVKDNDHVKDAVRNQLYQILTGSDKQTLPIDRIYQSGWGSSIMAAKSHLVSPHRIKLIVNNWYNSYYQSKSLTLVKVPEVTKFDDSLDVIIKKAICKMINTRSTADDVISRNYLHMIKEQIPSQGIFSDYSSVTFQYYDTVDVMIEYNVYDHELSFIATPTLRDGKKDTIKIKDVLDYRQYGFVMTYSADNKHSVEYLSKGLAGKSPLLLRVDRKNEKILREVGIFSYEDYKSGVKLIPERFAYRLVARAWLHKMYLPEYNWFYNYRAHRPSKYQDSNHTKHFSPDSEYVTKLKGYSRAALFLKQKQINFHRSFQIVEDVPAYFDYKKTTNNVDQHFAEFARNYRLWIPIDYHLDNHWPNSCSITKQMGFYLQVKYREMPRIFNIPFVLEIFNNLKSKIKPYAEISETTENGNQDRGSGDSQTGNK